MAVIKLVIFDCDGVLVDSERIAAGIFQACMRDLGLHMDLGESIRTFKGRSERDCAALLEEMTGAPLPPDFFPRCQRETFARFEAELKPVAGVEEALDRLRFPACVASSGTHEKMAVTLAVTGLLPRFRGRIFSATEVERGKPFPDLFLHAAAGMGMAPGNCVVVEDSVPGVRAARAAGMQVLGYVDLTPAEELAEAGAEVFDDMRKLPGMVERFSG